MLAFLLGRLRWSPAECWRATPREVAAALGRGHAPVLGRADLAALMRRFPDAPSAPAARTDDEARP